MKKLLSLTAVLLGVLIFSHQFGQSKTMRHVPASEVYVVDGDTLGHGDDRYRLIGFDTPETFRAQCDAEKVLGLKATARLTKLIRSAGKVELEIEPNLDRYGRFLAVGRAGDKDIGAILISESLARPYQGGKRQSWCG